MFQTVICQFGYFCFSSKAFDFEVCKLTKTFVEITFDISLITVTLFLVLRIIPIWLSYESQPLYYLFALKQKLENATGDTARSHNPRNHIQASERRLKYLLKGGLLS